MLTLLSELKFLTARDDIVIKENDFGVLQYMERKAIQKSQLYSNGKEEYATLRNHEYTFHGRKSKHIGYSIKKLEEALKQYRVVYCSWSDNVAFQILLSNGLLVHIGIDSFTGDVIRMTFDKFLIGKLVSENVCDVIITRMHILISYDVNQVTFVYLQKPSLNFCKNAFKKIRSLDPKIFNYIISGSHSKKISRHLTCNNCYDLLAVWTKSSQNEVYPWRPTFRDQDRANIHIYRLGQNKLDLICYYWTENDPIQVEFSKVNQNQLRSIEQKVSRKGEVTIEICVYQVNNSKIQRTSVTSIPLQSPVCCHEFSPDNEKLMLGCIDGSVILFDEGRGITHLIKAAFIPTIVSWHSDSAIIVIANEKCQVQYFDISLACLRNQISNEEMVSMNVLDISNFLSNQQPTTLLKFCCSKKPDLNQYSQKFIQNDSYILCLFENGPIAMIRLLCGNGHKGDIHTSGFTADVLIHQYLKVNNVQKAINVLLCLNWDIYGSMLMISLHKIANYIFKQPFQPEREIQLQKALGSFFVPVKPLCMETKSEFGDQVKDIARKFFQYLLRNKSFEKAFTLAIDIDDEDLFMDLTNCAKENGCIELAQDSYLKAEQLISRSDSRQSFESHESCYGCITNSDSSEEYGKPCVKEKPGPENASKIQWGCITTPEIRSNISEEVLKVSHFSKNLLGIDSIFDHQKNRFLEKNSKSSEISRVVDVIPPRNAPLMFDYRVPDQTIGIPIESLSHRKSFNFSKSLSNVQESSSNPKELQIIHHPCRTGKIPANFNKKKLSEINTFLPHSKTISPGSGTITNINRCAALQHTSSAKREIGEKTKVKFSKTVTDIPRNEKDRTKKTFANGVHSAQTFDSKRELQDSLPLCHPKDYLKDFMPIRYDGRGPDNGYKEEGDLTWV